MAYLVFVSVLVTITEVISKYMYLVHEDDLVRIEYERNAYLVHGHDLVDDLAKEVVSGLQTRVDGVVSEVLHRQVV